MATIQGRAVPPALLGPLREFDAPGPAAVDDPALQRRVREALAADGYLLLLWYKRPPAGYHAYHRFHFIGSRCWIEPLGTGSSMETVSRQESVPNGSMQHRELLKWHC